MCDLMGDWNKFAARYNELVKYVKRRYSSLEINVEKSLEELKSYRQKLSGMICDTISLVNDLATSGKEILVEGAQSSMLDVDFGTYPYVTSSNCSVGGVCTGLGLSPKRINNIYAVVKAYTTRVGSGAFPTEISDSTAEILRGKGAEYGVTTGRPRRIGWLDTMIVRYSNMINNFDAIALTKLDILDHLDEIKIGYAYKDKNTKTELVEFPPDSFGLDNVEVVYEVLPGWKVSTSGCKSYDSLPKEARMYIETAERLIGVPIRWIGTGPDRDSILIRAP